MAITFSSDGGGINEEDGRATGRIAEGYFKTANDPEQAHITVKRARWLWRDCPECINIIKSDNMVVGSTLVLPCTTELMELFISKKINEEQLFDSIQKTVDYGSMQAIYLCSAVLIPGFRRKGLASQGLERSVRKMMAKRRSNQSFSIGPIRRRAVFWPRRWRGTLG
ncbi:MAG: hypothetical protein JXB14_01535 [Candidatus Altiarchaeota archaeon]|nr:hypothetical protein [Candidatus Altiarchaeota archaeon]